MKSIRIGLLFGFIFYACVSFSQQNNLPIGTPKPVLFFPAGHFTGMRINKILPPGKPDFILPASQFSFSQNNNLHYFHYEIPSGAVFCRMENELRNTFNIWIKIRAGTDESYNEIKPQ